MHASIKCWKSQASNVYRDIGVPETTIHGWLRDEEKLRDFVDIVDITDITFEAKIE